MESAHWLVVMTHTHSIYHPSSVCTSVSSKRAADSSDLWLEFKRKLLNVSVILLVSNKLLYEALKQLQHHRARRASAANKHKLSKTTEGGDINASNTNCCFISKI